MIQGVEHIALCAENVPALIAWYQKIFQVDLVKEGQKGPFFLKFPDGFLIEFLETAGGIPPAPKVREKGFRHIALSVSSLEEMVETLNLKQLYKYYDLLLLSQQRFDTQLNKQLMFEEILIQWSKLNSR